MSGLVRLDSCGFEEKYRIKNTEHRIMNLGKKRDLETKRIMPVDLAKGCKGV